MEKIIVQVDWCGKNYAGYINDARLGGAVFTTGKTFSDLQSDTVKALQFHIESCLADGDKLPENIAEGKYTLEYEKRISAILHEAQKYTTLAALARVTGMKNAQLSHYANAVTQPKHAQKVRIVNGLKIIGQQCMSLA